MVAATELLAIAWHPEIHNLFYILYGADKKTEGFNSYVLTSRRVDHTGDFVEHNITLQTPIHC